MNKTNPQNIRRSPHFTVQEDGSTYCFENKARERTAEIWVGNLSSDKIEPAAAQAGAPQGASWTYEGGSLVFTWEELYE